MQVVQAASPNFVWIIADDMSPDIAAYGAPGVKTPNLDRLATEGRRYTRAYASAPVCSSSRSAFILGCYQTTTGLQAHDVENPQPLAAPYKHLPGLLREAGYYVTNASAPGGKKKNPKTHYNFAHDAKVMFDGNDWTQRKSGQPFFAQFQISEPHRPFPIPESFDEEVLRQIKLPPNYPDHPLTRRDWYAYLRSVEVVDQRVGAILDQLEKEGVLQDTVVMFFADHGRPMPWGKQWLSVEGLQVPLLIRGPNVAKETVEERLVSLIDLAPSMLSLASLPVPEWMQGSDVLSGSFPDRPQIFAARDRCGDAQDRIRAVITPRQLLVKNFNPELPYLSWSSYKETSYPGMPLLRELKKTGVLSPMQARYAGDDRAALELYDLESDPTGLVNVAKDSQQKDNLIHLTTELDAWLESSKDKGALPDAATEPTMEQIRHDKKQDYLKTWTKRGFKQEPTDAQRLTWWMLQYGLPETMQVN
ncbi:putative sulfatase [Prosthecobacter fusiformis]|uniref:Putative sulfatase n=2 Tax=Prosthecobacter fusiformis TaxID=48464 RepID=A0A4R7RKA7_9BACT|nr:putative sulfatase [Prosthecobacter fusiformis]